MTAGRRPDGFDLHDLLSHRASATPDATALVDAATGDAWTYAEIHAAVEETAGRLAALGVEPGDHLGLVLPTRPATARLVHAAMRLGARVVVLGPDRTERELCRQVQTADLTTLVCADETAAVAVDALDAASGADVPLVSIDGTDRPDVTSLDEFSPAPFTSASWTLDDPLAMLFTSGTTGDPKAVVLSLRNVLASAVSSAFRLGVTPDDRWLVTLSMHHMGGLAPVYRSTLYGTCVVVRDSFDAAGVVDDIAVHDVTGVSLVPTMLTRMLDARASFPDSLRTVLLGGAPASRQLIERCRERSVPVYPTYGMTETASQIATARPAQAFDRPGTVGRPLLFTELHVVDDDGDPLPGGESGELVVSGPTVTPGYYGDPDATDAAFSPLGFRTGDVGYRDGDGYVYVHNRRDDRIVTGGENVDPGEVVAVLREHPNVRDAAVVGLPDDEWGERVAALVEPAGEPPSRESVDSFCRDRLAAFKLPRTVGFADALPRTVSGTVDRDAVRDALLDAGGRE